MRWALIVQLQAPRRGNPRGAPSSPVLQRAQEVQDILLRRCVGLVEGLDDGVRLGRAELLVARAAMRSDRFQQVGCAAVMQEEDPLAESPQRRGPELVAR